MVQGTRSPYHKVVCVSPSQKPISQRIWTLFPRFSDGEEIGADGGFLLISCPSKRDGGILSLISPCLVYMRSGIDKKAVATDVIMAAQIIYLNNDIS
jgi:hypothetical protein